MKCKYLEGKNIAPKTAAQARALIGKRVQWLQDRDIDKSGRGYYFPQSGTIAAVHGRNVAVGDPNNFVIYLSDLREMILLPDATKGQGVATASEAASDGR